MYQGVSESDEAKKKKKTVVSKAVLKAETLVKPSPKSKKEVCVCVCLCVCVYVSV